ncbi:MAG: hypothetical protein ACRDZ7_03980, partial [Acidimicrobiia bacterium]
MRPAGKAPAVAALSLMLVAAATWPSSASTTPGLPASVRTLLDPAVVTPHLSAGGGDALVRSAEALGAALGMPIDAAPTVAAAHVSDGIAGRLALLL